MILTSDILVENNKLNILHSLMKIIASVFIEMIFVSYYVCHGYL